MPKNWKITSFKDVAEINPCRSLDKGTLAKYVPMSALEPFVRKITYLEKRIYKGGTKFKNDDTLLAKITPCLENGKTAFVNVLDKEEVAFGSSEFIVLSGKPGKTNPEFLYYLAIEPNFRKAAISSMTGTSGRQRVQNSILENISIALPSILEQKKIAKILSSFDDKIELNNKINENLEIISQAIFKHWFIDFEFPNEQGKPYKSSGGEFIDSELGKIPKGWKILNFSDISNLIMGVSPQGSTYNNEGFGLPLINGAADFKDNIISPNKYSNKPIKVCNSGDIVLCIRATIGNITFSDKEYCLGRGVAALRPIKKIYKYILYFNLLFSIKKIIKQASGSVIIGLSKEDINNIKFVNPPEKILNSFHIVVDSIFSLIEISKKQNIKLSQIHDTLLPKLINGKIRLI